MTGNERMAPGERPSPETPGVSLHDTFPRDQITVNPDLWQHKLDRTGAGQALAHIKTRDQWDPQAVRDIYLYRFPDGHVELMDGHSRMNAGDRVEVEGYPSVIFDGNNYSVEDARATAALINIKRQTGTVVDSSKAMRDLGLTVEDLAHYGADPNAEHTRIAVGLSNSPMVSLPRLLRGICRQQRVPSLANCSPGIRTPKTLSTS